MFAYYSMQKIKLGLIFFFVCLTFGGCQAASSGAGERVHAACALAACDDGLFADGSLRICRSWTPCGVCHCDATWNDAAPGAH